MDYSHGVYGASEGETSSNPSSISTSPSSTPRSKQFHHKTRSGCATCKKRRVKCDETKPFCRKCVTTNRYCEGYAGNPQPRVFVSDNTITVAPSTTSLGTTPWSADTPALTMNTAALSRPLSRGESGDLRSLQFFQNRTAPMLGGWTTFEQEFWCRLVPQMAESEPALRHIVIALASRQELVDYGSDEVLRLSYLQGRHYAESLRVLNSVTTTASSDRDNRVPQAGYTMLHTDFSTAIAKSSTNWPVILMSSLLYLAYENFQDLHKQTAGGLVHFVHGLKMLREEKMNSVAPLRAGGRLLSQIFEPMFARLEMVLSLFVAPTVKSAIIRPKNPKRPRMPAHFLDLHEARLLFVAICRWRFRKESLLEPWNVRSKAFHETRVILLNWYSLLMAYQDRLLPDANIEKTRVTALIAQYRLLFMALIYSARKDLHGLEGLIPEEVDLSAPDAVSVTYVVLPAFTRFISNEERNLDPLGIRIWPVAELTDKKAGHGTVRFTFVV